MGDEDRIVVHVRYRDVEQVFEGPVEEVWRAVNKFFSELIPIFRLVGEAVLTIDLADLIEELKDLVSLSDGRIIILADKKELPDKDVLLLGLLGAYIGHRIGALPKETLSSSELREMLEKTAKITSTRLGELRKSGWIEKTDRGEYRITPLGIFKFREKRLPKIIAKLKKGASSAHTYNASASPAS